ncbi:hypothetical protein, partial [Kingella kingae]|uniref:hypothetical protein n=1 Tax=Kingella kingae TaxID=504 RepID=UPI001E48310D
SLDKHTAAPKFRAVCRANLHACGVPVDLSGCICVRFNMSGFIFFCHVLPAHGPETIKQPENR